MDPITIAFSLAQFAPQILRWLGASDKAADAAQDVVEIAQAVTGKATGSEALEALRADPSQVLEFRKALAAQEADLDKAYLADVQHARETHRDHWMPAALTIALWLSTSLMLWGLFKYETPPANKEVVYLLVGQVIGAFSTAVAYWLGSSRGSANKQDDINRLLQALQASANKPVR